MNSKGETITCDIAVIGGGPAGMMAAGTAAAAGADVVLLEKNRRPGKKLLITGKGRCNITNADFDPQSFVSHFGKNGRRLLSVLNRFGVEATMEFFTDHGVPVKVERGGRVFPESDSAADVLGALTHFMKENGVRVMTGSRVRAMTVAGGRLIEAATDSGIVEAKCCILCAGGRSYPATGSDGAGYDLARSMGHTVTAVRPSLVPVVLGEEWAGELEGLSLRNVSVGLIHKYKTVAEEFGEALFTADGMSGPVILDLSRRIGELLPDLLELSIDLKPALDGKALDERIQRDFSDNPNRQYKNSLDRLLPASMARVIVRLSGIDPQKKVNSITRDERKRIVDLLKKLRASVKGLEGFDRAIVTAGGVSLDEIDMRTMRSRIAENLYFAGEIIDIDGPTGGFNLQICWSTGYCAGQSAAESL